ncbi:MAG: molybdopterin-dependent oxidoreductase [Nitrospirae bacterium]|nr:molybdopterin-dependent oxidoreductase [Nitrospirota bacterium]
MNDPKSVSSSPNLDNNDHNKSDESPSRRTFLQLMAGAGGSLAFMTKDAWGSVFTFFEPFDTPNPLAQYPNRGWESVYRDLLAYDSTFSFLCAPNDTHNCLLRAYVKNGVITRLGPTYGFGKAVDLYGNKASHRWEPRCCQKGLALVRRFYGDRRCKYPLVRAGFRQWVMDGFPRDPETGRVPSKYVNRGRDGWLRVSWDEAFQFSAKAMANIAETYSGEQGVKRLKAQGYDEAMVEAVGGAGVQTIKFRGGMAALGATRIFAQYRLANSMALLDAKIRNVGPDKAIGARGWDNYSWHTDLPPGHPMVTGQQTVDWDLVCVENAKLVIAWGMNWIATKMPDAHWLTEARLKGTKTVVIACEYSATANKADAALVVRPGTTPALALGLAGVILKEKLHDEEYIRRYTDLPFLVRMDNLKLLRAAEVWPDRKASTLRNYVSVEASGAKSPPNHLQPTPIVPEALRNEWGDYVVWDETAKGPKAVSRDEYGKKAAALKPAVSGAFTVKLASGESVAVRTVFDLLSEYVEKNFNVEQTSEITWAPKEGIEWLAREIAKNKAATLFAVGMGPNQFFNNDLKDRAIFFLAALTRNIGLIGANVGSFAGNYRAAFFNGLPQFIAENPFDLELDGAKPSRPKGYSKAESVHYFNDSEHVLRAGKTLITGKSHIPTPTKAIHVTNSNSLIGNAKGHYESVINVFPRVEFIAVNEWWWTASCEYADVVFPVDSWAEFKYPDLTISVTNPFLYVYPRSPLPRIFNTRSDLEVAAGLSNAMADVTGDSRFRDMWKFVNEGTAEPYLQRVLDHSSATRGYKMNDIEKKAQEGVPSILLSRTYPKAAGWEQSNEDKPWYTKSGRLEFYRDEPEFIDSGENMLVYREPVDSTFYEPNVIVSAPHPALKPKSPEDYGVNRAELSGDKRQTRHVVKPWSDVKNTQHPLMKEGHRFIYHTPKYRHGAHTTPVDTDVVAVWFGPFGDVYRHDKRKPFVVESFVDINPLDGKELGIEDGDYVWIDADPADRPYRGWKKGTEEYKLARLLLRARYYPGTPRGVARTWHNMFGSTYQSVKGHETNPTGLAKGPETGYQSIYRYGSHQSCTRGWLKPTWMTDSLVRKDLLGQKIGKGFMPDVHCPTGAPRESFVKITKAEDGGYGGEKLWKPAKDGFRPGYENDSMKSFLQGGFVKVKA